MPITERDYGDLQKQQRGLLEINTQDYYFKNIRPFMKDMLLKCKTDGELLRTIEKVINAGDVYEGNFIFGMITNSLSIGGIKNITGRDTKLDDGLFEVTLVRQVNNINDLNDIVSYFILGDRECEAVIHFTASRLEIISEQEVDWTLDGEYGGNIKKAVIENLHNKICFRK